MYCVNCGNELVDGARFCSACGWHAVDEPAVAVAAEASGEEIGGVSAALASGRSRSRLRITPLILLVLVLALTTAVAAASYYVYTQVYLPSVERGSYEAFEASEGNTPDSNEAYHYVSNHYEFDLPEYWRDRVTVIQDGDSTYIYAKKAYDDGYELRLARIFIDRLEGLGGDVSNSKIFAEEYAPGQAVVAWANTPALGYANPTISNESLEEHIAAHYYNVSLDLFEDYLDLATGGTVTTDDLRSAPPDEYFSQSFYAREALPPLIEVKRIESATTENLPEAEAAESLSADASSPNAEQSTSGRIDSEGMAKLSGWWQSVGNSQTGYWHIVNDRIYLYHVPYEKWVTMNPPWQDGFEFGKVQSIQSVQRYSENEVPVASEPCTVLISENGQTFVLFDSNADLLNCINLDGSGYSGSSSKQRLHDVPEKLLQLAQSTESVL